MYSKDFIEMCDDNNLRILNGAFEGDEEGSFTYSSTVGDSVNDVAAVSNSIIHRIHMFKVENATYSDHFPISISLKFGKESKENDMKLLPKLIWRSHEKMTFALKIQQQLANCNYSPSLHS